MKTPVDGMEFTNFLGVCAFIGILLIGSIVCKLAVNVFTKVLELLYVMMAGSSPAKTCPDCCRNLEDLKGVLDAKCCPDCGKALS